MSKLLISDLAVINKKNIEFNKNLKYINYLDTSSITNNKIHGYQTLYIEKDKIPSRAKRFVKNNTIVYSSVRPRLCHFGILKDLPENPVVSTGFITIDAKEDIIDPYYLYYILTSKTNTEYLSSIADTSVSSYPSINPSDISNMEINIIEDINEQKKISNILKAIEFRIDNNNKINEELESMAKIIYDYWFLQFEFPNEEGKPYKSSGGKMVWNEELKREIPEGWCVKTLNDISEIKAGGDKPKVFSTNLTKECSVPIYSNGLENKGLYGYTERATIQEGSVTVSARGTIGYAVLRNTPFMPIVRLISISPKNKKYAKYIEIFMNKHEFNKNGSIQQQLTIPQIAPMKIICPADKVMNKFNNVMNSIIKKEIIIEQENKELAQLRDFLLPLLMNGQIGFKELALAED